MRQFGNLKLIVINPYSLEYSFIFWLELVYYKKKSTFLLSNLTKSTFQFEG